MWTLLQKTKARACNANNLQLFDLLQISRKEHDCRAACRARMRTLGDWKKTAAGGAGPLKFCRDIEGLLLRRQAQDAVLFYRIVRRERVKFFKDYIEKLPLRGAGMTAV